MAVTMTFTGLTAAGSSSGSVSITGDMLPTNAQVQDNTTSISYNTVLGDFVDFPIAIKRKIILKWDILSDAQVDALYYDGLLSIIKNNKRRFFTINVTGNGELQKKLHSVTANGIYYLGTPVEFERLGESNGVTYWTGELHFIQQTAYVLNNPVESSTT